LKREEKEAIDDLRDAEKEKANLEAELAALEEEEIALAEEETELRSPSIISHSLLTPSPCCLGSGRHILPICFSQISRLQS
jgi:hypothetical protein